MNEADKKKLLLSIKNSFHELGFSDEQISKLIKSRTKTGEIRMPFLRVNIKERFSLFENIFSKYMVDKRHMYDALSDGLLFSYLPSTLDDLLGFVQKNGFSAASFLEMLATTSHGRAVLGWGPKKIKENIFKTSECLKKYNLTIQNWLDMSLKCSNILKMNSESVFEKVERWISFGERFGFNQDNMIKVIQKTPDLLLKNIETIERKCEIMGDFVSSYGVDKKEWIDSCMKHPKVLCKDTNTLIHNISLYQYYFQQGVFRFSNKPDADSKHLMRYLMTSPQYFCIAPSSAKKRMEYAEILYKRGFQPTSAVLYITKAQMEKNLKGLQD